MIINGICQRSDQIETREYFNIGRTSWRVTSFARPGSNTTIMSFFLRDIRRFVDADSTPATTPFYRQLQRKFGERVQAWHAEVIQCLREQHDVLVRTSQDSDKSLIYQALIQSPRSTVLVVSESLELMESQVTFFH